MKFKLYSPNAAKVSEIEVADFPVVEANKGVQALKQYLVSYRANQRQGNASTQNRGDQTNYSGKKI
jgi:ribosomal protein L4